VSARLLEALQPAAVELSLRVIEDEATRREQLDTLYAQRVEQARYATNLAERRYKEVDPSNRLVALTLERDWEQALAELDTTTAQLAELRATRPTTLSDQERTTMQQVCADVRVLWGAQATLEQRKQIVRLLLRRVEVEVHDNSERVSIGLHWSGGFESRHVITRPVQRFTQLECYDQLLGRALELALSGARTRQIAATLEAEGYHSRRQGEPLSASMVQKMLHEDPRSHDQLNNPALSAGQWLSADLAKALKMPEKRLKAWVTRGWVTAIQRPFGRTWVIYADNGEFERLQELVRSQTGQGSPLAPKKLRTPAPNPRKSP
jgi:hypothetical protein